MDFLCLEFVNSSWYITHKLFNDPLRNNDWLLSFADKWNIKSLSAPTEAELKRLIDMRKHLAEIFAKIAGGEKLLNDDIEFINGYMSCVSFFRVLNVDKENRKLYEEPLVHGWKWFMAEIAASFSRLYSSQYVNNLRICQNPECGWFFIDESKKKNRKWCDDTCASLMKVRRFRQRQKEKI
ncbi:CGNR zinc finger [Oxobacter pfennigii]|uniref:CGNR zinc finger n=1 Tax=Oxobacter pfennigii TaxID=36849 RepID=A0A0P8YG43_9CLOT|nr:CGNR zinc finger domain-containing protein [Oxobacter pfennigii]KPU46004.1 CGNR zinc finger [Oxobacter pfennigii]